MKKVILLILIGLIVSPIIAGRGSRNYKREQISQAPLAASHQVQQYQQPSNDQLIRQLEVKQRLMHRLSKLQQQYPEPVHHNSPKVMRRNHSSIAFPSILTIGLLGAFFYGLSWIPTANAQAIPNVNTASALWNAIEEIRSGLDVYCVSQSKQPKSPTELELCKKDELNYLFNAYPTITFAQDINPDKLVERSLYWYRRFEGTFEGTADNICGPRYFLPT